MFYRLLKLANELDQKGLYKEASIIDKIIKQASISSYRAALTKALKDEISMEFSPDRNQFKLYSFHHT